MNPNRNKNIIPIIVMIAALLLQGCGNEPKRNGTEQDTTVATAEIIENLQDSEIPERPDNSENLENSENTENSGNQETDWQTRKLTEMTLEQKVAQMFMPTLEQLTDAMNMGAITGQYKSGEAAVKTIAAGADIVLMPENFKEAYQGVLDAVAEGTLTEQRIDESVCRILEIKQKISCRNDTDKL